MGSSRENSPDWLRCFKAPTQAPLELSSDSEPSPVGSPSKEERSDNEELSLDKSSETVDDDENLGKILSKSGAEPPSSKRSRLKSPRKGKKVEDELPLEEAKSDNHKKRKGDVGGKKVAKKAAVESPLKSHALNRSVWTLSSDSELTPETSPTRENHIHHEESSDQKTSEQTGKGNNTTVIGGNKESPSKKACKDKPQKKGLEVDGHASIKEKKKSSLKSEGIGGDEVTEEEAPEKQIESQASSARLPLMLSDKVQRSKALVECEGGSIDLGGDMGAVGRVVISDTTSGDHEMYLDLKGTIYKTTIVPSRTFCVVSFGQSEAKIEAIMNDFIQLKPQSNVFEAETMVEGTLDGFSFDSDEEAEKLPKVQQTENDEDVEEKTTGKRKGKAEKTSGVARKRGKTVGGKAQPQKKVKRKAQVSKKTKTKK